MLRRVLIVACIAAVAGTSLLPAVAQQGGVAVPPPAEDAAPTVSTICPFPLGDHATYLVAYKVERLRHRPDLAQSGSVTVTPGQASPSQARNVERRGYFRSPRERAELETGMSLFLDVVAGKDGNPDLLSYEFTSVDLVAMRQVAGHSGTYDAPQFTTRKVAGTSNVDLQRPVVLELPPSGPDPALRLTLDVKLCSAAAGH